MLIAASGACIIAGDAGAQFAGSPRSAAVVDTGTRVRVSVASVASVVRQSPFDPRAQWLKGTVRAIAPDTVYLELPNVGGALAIPRAQVRRVQVSLGAPSRLASAVEVGSVGAVIFALLTWSAHQNPETRRYDSTLEALCAGAGLGFSLGGLLGAQRPRERWRDARLPRSWRR